MSDRLPRVNELVKREISYIIQAFYRNEAVFITITAAEVSPDLRHAKIFYSVINSEENAQTIASFFSKNKKNIRKRLSQNIVLKYLPQLSFIPDVSAERGSRVIEIMDEFEDIDSDPENE